MTCAHVLDLIDAGPFAECSAEHLAAAWQHARGCPTCGPAHEAATSLAADLLTLPQVAPPPSLAASVLARVARLEETEATSVPGKATAASGVRDWSMWATAGGVAVVALAMLNQLGGASGVVTTRGFTMGFVAMPAATAGTWLLLAGLAVYIAGLFAPIGDRRRL